MDLDGAVVAGTVGRPPNHVLRFYASFSYQAGIWDRNMFPAGGNCDGLYTL